VLDAKGLDELHVILVAVVVIRRHHRRVAALDPPRLALERVPDRRTATVLLQRACEWRRGMS
jgi:hypothetical protein